MQKAKAIVFEFTSFKFEPENKLVYFNYKTKTGNCQEILFTEKIEFEQNPDFESAGKDLQDKIFQCLHFALGISYYKAHCASIVRHNYKIAKEEANFWNSVYKNGLGEFFFKNQINPKVSPKFSFDKKVKPQITRLFKNNKFFVGVSGGKDSIVASELLKEQGADAMAVYTETQKPSELVDKVLEVLGFESLKIKRYLDQKIIDKNNGYLQGHIPISAIYAFLSIACCVFYKRTYFVASNEYSSNFGNIKYKGQIINHQWSKSLEFERLFQKYVKDFITPDVYYFSALRHFYEIRIAEIFCRYKKYFPYFSSCNKNFKISESHGHLWCGVCPKCAFAFLLMSAFLEKQEVLKIFGKNMLEDATLLPLFADILGFGKIKPFDCVGTFDESRVALYLAKDKFAGAVVVDKFLPKIKNPEKLTKKVFKTQASNAPDYLKFLGVKNTALLGFGREGEATKKYLESKFPGVKIEILDKKSDKNYLKKQNNFDILVKTPGISKEKVKILYTTATNIFFSETKSNGNKIIGVTGSKGKSTTASLICHILQQSGKNAVLLGNIGLPMLSFITNNNPKDTIFVLELSSYQLDDIRYSPDIAVVTNLFREHIDYHKTENNYYNAKKNIINFQTAGDVFIFNPENKKLSAWVKSAKSKAIPSIKKSALKDWKIPLIGEHNLNNVATALTVAKELGIEDKKIKLAVESFKGLPHRLEFVGEFSSIKFYDDAISTTPESTIAAIESLKNVGTIFLGGQDRGYNFSQLEKTIKKYKIENAVLFPDSGNKIKLKALNILKTKSMQKAVEFAYKNTKPGKICLLSCASPSYSLWKDFEEKGEQFKKFVKEFAK